MRITRLSLNNFRNHTNATLDWAPHLNVITGPNGAGKTNLIDAIHYLCMTRSFVAGSDRYVVAASEKYFMISGVFEGEIRSGFEVSCSCSRGDGKKFFVNGSPLDKFSDLVGMVPVVVMSPEDHILTSGGPSERRTFLDAFISQISPSYLRDLVRYKRVRRQRNRHLQEYRGPLSTFRVLLDPWDRQLVEAGSRIVAKRAEVLDNFRNYLADQFHLFSGLSIKPGLEYQTFCEPRRSVDEITQHYEQELDRNFEKELEREQTMVGPHRDEIVFYLGDRELRNYGSQGQHRLFCVALKLAQLFYYSDELEDLPIMLLDDVFGNLDPEKTEFLLDTLQTHTGQTFITSATDAPFQKLDWSLPGNARFGVNNGEIAHID